MFVRRMMMFSWSLLAMQVVLAFDGFTCARFTENEDWAALDFRRTTVPGSPLDFSFLADAPAGKYGFLKAGPDGHGMFEKDPAQRPRFYGGNFAWDSCFLEKDEVDRVADELVRLGYNWVRAHQHDVYFHPRGAKSSADIDPAKLDKFEYFIAAMKKRGIYFTMDCYSSRAFFACDEGLADKAGKLGAMRQELGVNPAAMANWKAFSRNLLTHVNPYTGLALKDEPAMIVLNLVNEDNKSDSDAELQMEVHREQLRFLRDEIGVKSMLTSLNMCSAPAYTVRRSLFDVIDLHMYFDHPKYEGGSFYAPAPFHSQLTAQGPAAIWRGNFFQRIWGKPCVTTEFRHCMPNVYRSEVGPIIGAYGALQDWDALMGYGYAEGADSLRGRNWNSNPFDTANDPFSLFGEKISILLFRRGDVQTARRKLCVTVPEDALKHENLRKDFAVPAASLGLLHQVGSICGKPPKGMKTAPVAELDGYAKGELPKDGVYVSDTKEITLDVNRRTLKVVTPCSETLTLSSGRLSGRFLSVANVSAPVTVSAHTLDGKSLQQSKSVLVFHLSDSANTGEEFTDLKLSRIVSFGKGPMLVRRDTVQARFAGKGWKVTALKCDGSAAGEVQVGKDGAFTLKTDGFPGGILAYHLTR